NSLKFFDHRGKQRHWQYRTCGHFWGCRNCGFVYNRLRTPERGMTYDQDDLDSLALCAWKEARGEGTPGMLAVMHVIYNRALAWYGANDPEAKIMGLDIETEAVHHAVYAKNQFT